MSGKDDGPVRAQVSILHISMTNVSTQVMAMFVALQRLGTVSQLVTFPDETSWSFERPVNIVMWHNQVPTTFHAEYLVRC